MQILRVFPRRTKATPRDELTTIDPPGLFADQLEFDQVHVSATFSWDLDRAHYLADAWDARFPGMVKLGGPAFNQRSGDFVAGRYLAHGYTITSRGCPNHCWFCRVPKVEGDTRELPIVPGWNILDDNILATSRQHFGSVCRMLDSQPRRAEFTGGLDATLLTNWHVEQLATISPLPVLFFAYDPGDDLEPLATAINLLTSTGFSTASHRIRCYVLIGFPKDTTSAADKRLSDVLNLGFTPMAMLWRDPRTTADQPQNWKHLQRTWARPAIIHSTTGGIDATRGGPPAMKKMLGGGNRARGGTPWP